MQFIFLAAGMGERLEPLTNGMSKVMLLTANKPFLQWTTETAEKFGKIIIVCRDDQNDIKEFAKASGMALVYQEKPLGTGDAMRSCEKYVTGNFIVINGDCYFSESDIRKVEETEGNALGVFPSESVKDFAVVDAKEGIVLSLEEKPATERNGLVNCGIYKFGKEIFGYLRAIEPSKRGEYEITDAVNMMAKKTKIIAIETKSWMTITHPWDILDVNEALLKRHGSLISKTALIMKGAVIEEPVAIGNNARIGPNCYVRKYSSIGNNCKIGNAVEVKNSVIMDNTAVPHLSYVGDSVIGRNCNLGAGFIAANLRLNEQNIGVRIKGGVVDSRRKKLGAIIGNNVKIGVRVTVMPGKKIYSNLSVPSSVTIKNDVEKQPNISKIGKVI